MMAMAMIVPVRECMRSWLYSTYDPIRMELIKHHFSSKIVFLPLFVALFYDTVQMARIPRVSHDVTEYI